MHLLSQAEADLRAFEEFVRAEPLVRECWMLSGEVDFILKCVAPDMATFQDFVTHLTAAPRMCAMSGRRWCCTIRNTGRGAAGSGSGRVQSMMSFRGRCEASNPGAHQTSEVWSFDHPGMTSLVRVIVSSPYYFRRASTLIGPGPDVAR